MLPQVMVRYVFVFFFENIDVDSGVCALAVCVPRQPPAGCATNLCKGATHTHTHTRLRHVRPQKHTTNVRIARQTQQLYLGQHHTHHMRIHFAAPKTLTRSRLRKGCIECRRICPYNCGGGVGVGRVVGIGGNSSAAAVASSAKRAPMSLISDSV